MKKVNLTKIFVNIHRKKVMQSHELIRRVNTELNCINVCSHERDLLV